MKFLAVTCLAVMIPAAAFAQSASQEFPWEKPLSLEPLSRTATAITGPIELSGSGNWGEGSEMTITFGNGSASQLTSAGVSWREWDVASSEKVSAELFEIERDPGGLVNGNTLCGGPGDPATYLAVYDQTDELGAALGMAVFGSEEPPTNINSDGLCGTFSYALE